MSQEINTAITESVRGFRLPRYDEIPNVGLYLEQTAKYLTDYLAPLEDVSITPSMISNYVKKKILASPHRKQYDRDQIAALFFMAITKNVLSLENIRTLLTMSRERYDNRTAYDYFCDDFEETLFGLTGKNEHVTPVTAVSGDLKSLVHGTIITVANKIVLDKYFSRIGETGEA